MNPKDMPIIIKFKDFRQAERRLKKLTKAFNDLADATERANKALAELKKSIPIELTVGEQE